MYQHFLPIPHFFICIQLNAYVVHANGCSNKIFVRWQWVCAEFVSVAHIKTMSSNWLISK
jgi:hypothetical protein